MNNLIILVQGNAQFIADIIMGFTAMYDRNVVTSLAALMLLIGLLLNTVKYSLDSERNVHPLREFFVGCLFFMILVHPSTTPRFNVQIEPVGATHEAYIIEGVPFLASIPAWAATNLFGALTKEYQQNFGDVHGVSDGLQGAGVNPFEAVVHLHSIDPSGIDIAPGFNRTFNQYIANCYIEPSFIHNISVATAEEILKAPPHELLLAMEPSVSNWFSTTTFLNGLQRSGVACTEAFQSLSAIISNPVNQNTITQYFDNLGVNMNSAGMLGQVLGDLSSPTPGQLALGRWLSFKVAENIGGSQLEHAFGRGLFEAKQQRLYQRMGERSMFLQTAIPLITALEAFVFFIAPVMMILAVLGGMGLSYVGKYLMILVFTNLWSLIAVFVDTLTFQTVRDTINLGPAAAYSNDISTLLSLGTQGNLITEIEGALVVAASMTAAIPMLAMFMLYGGVHSLMGVMGKFGGNYDGKGASPDLTTQSGLDTQFGGMNIQQVASGSAHALNVNFDKTGVEINSSESLGKSISEQQIASENETSMQAQQVLETTSKGLNRQAAITTNDSHASGESLQKAEQARDAGTAIDKRSRGEEASQAQVAAAHAYLKKGFKLLGLQGGIEGKMGTELKSALTNGSDLTEAQMEEFAELFNQMDTEQLANVIAASGSIGEGETWSDTNAAIEAFQTSQAHTRTLGDLSSRNSAFGGGSAISGSDLRRWGNNEVYAGIGGEVHGNDTYKNRLRDAGLLGENLPFNEDGTVNQLGLENYGGLGAVVNTLMHDRNAKGDDIATNAGLSAMMLEQVAEHGQGAQSGNLAHQIRALRDYEDVMRGANGLSASDVSAAASRKLTPSDKPAAVKDAVEQSRERLSAGYVASQEEHKATKENYGKEGPTSDVAQEIEKAKVKSEGRNPANDRTDRSLMRLLTNSGGLFGSETPSQRRHRLADIAAGISTVQGDEFSPLVARAMEHMLADRAISVPHTNRIGHVASLHAASEFLETEGGKEFFESLDENEQTTVMNSLADLHHGGGLVMRSRVAEDGEFNYMDHAVAAPDDKRTQDLYDNFVGGMGDNPTEEQKVLAYQAAQYFSKPRLNIGMSNLDGVDREQVLPGGLTRGVLQDVAATNEQSIIDVWRGNSHAVNNIKSQVSSVAEKTRQRHQVATDMGYAGGENLNPLTRAASEAPMVDGSDDDTGIPIAR